MVEGHTFTARTADWKNQPGWHARVSAAGRFVRSGRRSRYVRYLDDFPVTRSSNVWDDTAPAASATKIYVVQTTTKVIERCMLMTTDPGDLVLDPTCGSGTTAFVAEQWGRRWITIDTSRVALALARQRLMGARFPYYLLADSTDGRAKESRTVGHSRCRPRRRRTTSATASSTSGCSTSRSSRSPTTRTSTKA